GSAPGEYAGSARRSLEEMFESQPLLVGAVGLALGATLGAILPPTETENRLLGEQRDRVAAQLQDAAAETYERGKERLAESGLTPSQGAAAVGEVARDIREAVERKASDVTAAARSSTERDGGTSGQRPG
ncbi:hypothetical protein, partial [Falsiroseomonas oryziterrae]